jgi:hypothetical protein
VVHPPSPRPPLRRVMTTPTSESVRSDGVTPGPTTSFAPLRPAGYGRPLWTGWGGVCPPPRPAGEEVAPHCAAPAAGAG